MGITLVARQRMKWGIGKLSSSVVIDVVCPSFYLSGIETPAQ
jgi:hypothetical protein